MSAGFRKSLFGFNADDVMEYIENSQKEFSKKESQLNEKVNSLNESLTDSQNKIAEILNENERLSEELKKYTDKYEEINRLSQNIGKLYLVAEANADAVIDNAKQTSEITNLEAEKNISSVEAAHDALLKLNTDITETVSAFSDKLNSLIESLGQTKNIIAQNRLSSDEKFTQYNAMMKELRKG